MGSRLRLPRCRIVERCLFDLINCCCNPKSSAQQDDAPETRARRSCYVATPQLQRALARVIPGVGQLNQEITTNIKDYLKNMNYLVAFILNTIFDIVRNEIDKMAIRLQVFYSN